MSERNKTNIATGLSFTDLLAIVFIVLKLTKVITWSWWWVLSPLWIPLAVGLVLIIIWLILTAILKV